MCDIRIYNHADPKYDDKENRESIVVKVYREDDRFDEDKAEWTIKVTKDPVTGAVFVATIDHFEGADSVMELGKPGMTPQSRDSNGRSQS